MSGEAIIVPGEPALACNVAGSGPTVLFLHGVGGNRGNWDDQLAAVAAAGWRGVALDARGYGGSAWAAPAGFTDYADDAARVIRHFGGPAHVVGLSMGGRVALDLWRRYPDLVASLSLADTSAGSAVATTPEAIAEAVALRAKPLLDGKTPTDIAPAIVAKIAGPGISAAARQRLLDSHAALHREAYLAALGAVISFGDFPAWADIAVPALVIVGEHDAIAPPAHARAMAAAMPDARLIEIPGAGHVSNIEAPAAFNNALIGFLASLKVMA